MEENPLAKALQLLDEILTAINDGEIDELTVPEEWNLVGSWEARRDELVAYHRKADLFTKEEVLDTLHPLNSMMVHDIARELAGVASYDDVRYLRIKGFLDELEVEGKVASWKPAVSMSRRWVSK